MSGDVVNFVQAVVRDQLRSLKTAELGVVTAAYSHEQASDKNNYGVDVRLRDSGLELKRVPVAAQRIGAVAIPNVDDLVLVHYLHGDIHSAVVHGRLYNDQDRPPEAKPQEFVYVSPDPKAADVRRAYLEFPNGNTLLLDDDALTLEMGKSKVTINHDGDVVIESNGALRVTSAGDTSLDVKGNLSMTAGGDVTIEGNKIAISGMMETKVEGGASASLKAGTIDIGGQVNFSPS